ncbi:MAG: S-layer homology domain-containing protein, partial [Ruminococcus sp.]|nr:S-layer homology domain-containing protein [Ruminococcus sp.]
MSNKIKKLICSLLASAMLVTSAGVVAWAAPEDEAATTETTVTETATSDDSSTADQTDEEKEAEGTEATEATEPAAEEAEAPAAETTEAPEVTAAPVTTSSSASYDSDEYYQKSLALCSSLGIISGFEDGSVKPEEKVTRAQMASIVLRMLALNGTSPYQGIFTDVSDSHWAASQIQSAYEASIVSGMGDGTFAPDAEVTYAQVIVMLVNA